MSEIIYKVVQNDDGVFWFNDAGLKHRVGGPAEEFNDGKKTWWFENKLHRSDAPAVEYANGGKEFWFDGKLHCDSGPAIIRANGQCMWALDGEIIPESVFNNRIKDKQV